MNNDLDSLLRKLEAERKRTFTSLQRELENWKKNYESLLRNIETSLEKDYDRIKEKLNQIDSLIESKLNEAKEEVKKDLQKSVEEKKKDWIAILRSPLEEMHSAIKEAKEQKVQEMRRDLESLNEEIASLQPVKPVFRLIPKVLKITLLLFFPMGLALGGVIGWMKGKELGERSYQEKLAELEKIEKNYKLIKPEWLKKWEIDTIHDKQGSFPCLISRTALEKRKGRRTWTLMPEGIGENVITMEEDRVEKYCIPLDPLHQRHIEP